MVIHICNMNKLFQNFHLNTPPPLSLHPPSLLGNIFGSAADEGDTKQQSMAKCLNT